MEIKYFGHACFSIEDKGFTVVANPYREETGLKLPSLKGDVVLVSHDAAPYNNIDAVDGEPRVFSWPGEYETGGVHFKCIHSFHNPKESEEQLENNISLIHFNGIHLCHLGAQGTKLTSEQLEQIGDVDILFVPVGGNSVIDVKTAKEVVEQIEPRVVIPMMYNVDASNLGLGTLADFLKVMGGAPEEPVDTFNVKRSELPEDNSKVVVLNVAE